MLDLKAGLHHSTIVGLVSGLLSRLEESNNVHTDSRSRGTVWVCRVENGMLIHGSGSLWLAILVIVVAETRLVSHSGPDLEMLACHFRNKQQVPASLQIHLFGKVSRLDNESRAERRSL